jgi:hypothetical protein
MGAKEIQENQKMENLRDTSILHHYFVSSFTAIH